MLYNQDCHMHLEECMSKMYLPIYICNDGTSEI